VEEIVYVFSGEVFLSLSKESSLKEEKENAQAEEEKLLSISF